MIQDPNPIDYPHLEAFTDWLYLHVEELPTDAEELKTALRIGLEHKREAIANREWLKRWHAKHSAPITKGKPI